MGVVELQQDSKWDKLLRILVVFVAAAMILYAGFTLLSFSSLGLAVLAGALLVGSLAGKYTATIPKTRITFFPRTILIFWSTMWLGVPGGILVALCALVSEHFYLVRPVKDRFASIAAEVVAVAVAGSAYYLFLGKLFGYSALNIGGFHIPNEMVIAAFLMAAVHFVTLHALFAAIAGRSNSFKSAFKPGQLAITLTGYSVCVAFTLSLYVAFNQFGIEFGLFIAPLAVFADLAYRLHVKTIEQKTREIAETSRVHLATVEALSTAIDARDQVGAGHVRRTQILAVGLGGILGLSSDEIESLRMGSLLHDIGKLAIPDHILNKPGKLTPAEREKSKTHASVGASILEKVGFRYPVVPTVRHHHELWDGSGYPDGLKGESIPITSRILRIADSYDTLRVARPYRLPYNREQTCMILRSGAGSQFDPTLVEIFLRNLDILEAEIDAQGLSYEGPGPKLVDSASVIDTNSSPNFVEQIKQANREVFTLYSLAKDFSASLDMQETLSLFSKKISDFAPYDLCVVYLLVPNGNGAYAAYAKGRGQESIVGRKIRFGEGATGYAIEKRTSVENVDPNLDLAFSGMNPVQEFRTMASFPLLADGKLVGAVSLYSATLSHYQDEHLRLLETVSRIAADSIANALRHSEAEVYAQTDPMTGLPNSRSLRLHFEKEASRTDRTERPFNLLVLDLDGFKSVNDSFGHKAGDQMLKEIGRVIRAQLREYDFLARYGGDEFVAIVPDTEGSDIRELAQRIEAAVSGYTMRVGRDQFARVGVSVGWASYPKNGESFDKIVESADMAMYRSKRSGREHESDTPSTSVLPFDEVSGKDNSSAKATTVSPDIQIIHSTSLN